MIWKLSYTAPGGVAVVKTLAEWGISGLRRRRVSQAPDEISFTTVEKCVDAQKFAYDGKVKILAVDGTTTTTWFVGWVADASLSLSGNQERRNYKARNAWKWFDQLTFQKVWYRAVDPTSQSSSLIGGYRSKMILNMGFNGSHQTVAQQITEIVAFVNQVATLHGHGNVLNMGTCPTTLPPWSDVNDITAAEAMKHQMKWMPHAVTTVDYTTDPPTLNVLDTLADYNVDMADEVIGQVNLTPRNDRVVDRVRIKYGQQNTTNGKQWVYDAWDIFPAPDNGTGTFLAASVTPGTYYYLTSGGDIVQSTTAPVPSGSTVNAPPPENTFDELMVAVNLVGWTANYVNTTIETMQWGSVNWLQRKLPFLQADGAALTASPVLKKVILHDGTVWYPGGAGLPLGYDVLTGSVMDGLKLSNGHDLVAQQYTAIYEIAHTKTTDTLKNEQAADTQTIKFTACNAVSGTYSGLQSSQSGDPIPTGLAQKLYEGLSVLQHDGSVNFKRRELDPSVSYVGRKLNIVGGNPDWTGMVIQSVDETVDDAAINVSIGVPKHLSAGDLVELLRVTRVRQRYIAPDTVQTGSGAGGVSSSAPKHTNADNSVGGSKITAVQSFTDKPPDSNGTLPSARTEAEIDTTNGMFRLVKVGADENRPVDGETIKGGAYIRLDLTKCKKTDGAGVGLEVREETVCVKVNGVISNKKRLIICSEPY